MIELFIDPRSIALAARICTVAVAVPFVGTLLMVCVRALGNQNRAFPTIAILSTLVSVAAVGWLWWTETEVSGRAEWIRPLDIGFGWHLDGLSLLFVVMAAGFALITVVYSSAYLPRTVDDHGRRWDAGVYYAALLFFTGAMLGLVLSEDLFQLYIFWELTDIASFVLIGLDRRNDEARRAAVKALIITTLGGLTLLVGFVVLAAAAGTSSIPLILEQGLSAADPRISNLLVILFLVGAATKSAQVPFYVWLPNAMIAPTPANAFLDSAALVAAGLFLVVRFQPLFGDLPLWTTGLVVIGAASMLIGGILALRQRNLKWLLAYSTLSLFGFIFVLAGLGQIFAALWFLLQHAVIKSGLFFAIGIVEQDESPSREAVRGISSWILIIVSGILALSLMGVPPLGGFWMKETFLVALLDEPARPLLAAVGVVAAALTVVYMVRFLRLAFFEGRDTRRSVAIQFPLLVPVVTLAAVTVIWGLFPTLASQSLVEPAAAAVIGESPETEFAYHLNVELLLSITALALGTLLYWRRATWQPRLARALQTTGGLDAGYRRAAAAIVHLGRWVQSVQNGSLQRYLYVVLLGFIALLLLVLPALRRQSWFEPGEGGPLLAEDPLIMGAAALLLLLIALGTLVTLTARTHLRMVLALGMVGFMIAGLFSLFAAPNLGLVQVHVETLATVLLILILVRVPHQVRRRFEGRSIQQVVTGSHLVVAALLGCASAGLSWLAINHQPTDPVADWYTQETMALVGAEDVVAAILVHFRAFDTLGEIVVFAITALGVLALVQRMREEEP